MRRKVWNFAPAKKTCQKSRLEVDGNCDLCSTIRFIDRLWIKGIKLAWKCLNEKLSNCVEWRCSNHDKNLKLRVKVCDQKL